ncbi:uncharacterized protein LOC130761981 isoform X3 [Actinidia eriantha]|uniref:uncharacterized protein LOC130761981 isoform X3 n=1 Tax=Actinidia eriantha TaxID=165200 RepID=UPI002582C39C|nr:uncharacterized protein LOC130761981 isoform X3 [Actinidia eriantha]
MDRYQKVEKPKPEVPINENEIRITAQGLVRNYISYATTLLQEKRGREIVLKAMGQAISKTVAIAEILKRRIPQLHQDTAISSVSITDVWEPIEEGLLPYQAPSNVEQPRPQYQQQQQQQPRPARIPYNEDSYGGGGRGRGRGRGRGWSRGGYGNYQENGGYSNWSRGGGRSGRGWGNRGGGYESGRGGGYESGRGGGNGYESGRGGGSRGYGRGRGRMGSRPRGGGNQAY